jgi:CheY-like chemotaxis protein
MDIVVDGVADFRNKADPRSKRRSMIAPCGYIFNGATQKEDQARAIASGFDYHLTKPVDPKEVEKLLHSYFARRAVSS